MKPGFFQMVAHVGHDGSRFSGERHRRMRDQAVDVIDAEADSFQVKRADGAVERLGFLDQGSERPGVRRVSAQECEEIGEAALGRLAAIGGHDRIIVECMPAWKKDERVSTPPT